MRSIVRNVAFYSFSLFVLTTIFNGVKVSGGVVSFIVGGLILTILFFLLKPILSVITFPLNLITMGLFSFFINVIILYLLTVIYPSISISSFQFNGFNLAGVIVPKVFINTFFAFVISSVVLSIVVTLLTWLIKK